MSRRLLAFAFLEGAIIVCLVALLVSVWPGEGSEVEAGTREPSNEEKKEPTNLRGEAARTDRKQDVVPKPVSQRVEEQTQQDSGVLGTVLYGRVVDTEGKAVERASVYLRREGVRRGFSSSVSGRGYALAGLDAGTWRITCRADKCVPFDKEIEIAGELHQRFDVVLQRAYMLRVVVVTPDGEPIQQKLMTERLYRVELSCVATRKEPIGDFPMTTLRSVSSSLGVGRWLTGRFPRGRELPKGCLGQFELRVSPPVWVSLINRHHVFAKKLVTPNQKEVKFEVSLDQVLATLGRTSFMVLDSVSRKPVVGCRVDFSDRQSGGAGTKTDAEGRYKNDKLPPGLLELNMVAKGYERLHTFVQINPGQDLDLGVMFLDPAESITGTVVGPDGKPLAARMECFRLDHMRFPQPLDGAMSYRSNTDGKFEIRWAGRGRYVLTANVTGVGSCGKLVDTTAGSVKDVRLQLAKTTKVHLVNKIPETKTYLLQFLAPQGHPVYGRLIRPGPNYPIEMPPGSYKVEIRENTTLIRSFDLRLGSTPTRIVIPQ